MAITLTEAAARRVRDHLSRSGGEGLRLGVRKTGCSGLAYVVELAESVREGDQVFESEGIRVVIDRDSLPYLDGMRVDFRAEELGESFTFDNPNVAGSCGCGESFSV